MFHLYCETYLVTSAINIDNFIPVFKKSSLHFFVVLSGYTTPLPPIPLLILHLLIYLSLQTKVHTKLSMNMTDRPLPKNSLVWFPKSVSLSALLPSSFPSLYLLTSPLPLCPHCTSPSPADALTLSPTCPAVLTLSSYLPLCPQRLPYLPLCPHSYPLSHDPLPVPSPHLHHCPHPLPLPAPLSSTATLSASPPSTIPLLSMVPPNCPSTLHYPLYLSFYTHRLPYLPLRPPVSPHLPSAFTGPPQLPLRPPLSPACPSSLSGYPLPLRPTLSPYLPLCSQRLPSLPLRLHYPPTCPSALTVYPICPAAFHYPLRAPLLSPATLCPSALHYPPIFPSALNGYPICPSAIPLSSPLLSSGLPSCPPPPQPSFYPPFLPLPSFSTPSPALYHPSAALLLSTPIHSRQGFTDQALH
jgi:hypothetical protein